MAVCGDYNIAPADADIYDPEEWGEAVLASSPERAALSEILALGYKDAHRLFEQPEGVFFLVGLSRRRLSAQSRFAHRPYFIEPAVGTRLSVVCAGQNPARLGAAIRPRAGGGKTCRLRK